MREGKRTSWLPMVGVLAGLAGIPLSAAPAAAGPGRCLGVTTGDSPAAPLQDSVRVDLGIFVLVLDGNTSSRDSAYVVDLLKDILPPMTEVLGAPVGLEELGIEFGGSGSYSCARGLIHMPDVYAAWQVDDDGDGAVDEDPYDGLDNDGDGAVDEDPPNSPLWDSVFTHEVAHAFQGDLVCHGYPRWFTEGMAEAAAWLVSEKLAAVGGRHLLGSAFDMDPGSDDLLDRQGAQVLGGAGRPIDRASADMAYAAAGGTLLLPCLAEQAAGRARPLARLTEALRRDLPSVHQFETVDRVFLSPVDGVLPPSRWMQNRAVVCPSVGDGAFMAFTYPDPPVNPDRIGMIYFSRRGYETQSLPLTGLPTYTGIFGNPVPATRLVVVPELPPGGYRVDLEEPAKDGPAASARSWILVLHHRFDRPRGRTGVAAVFVDRWGNPVEVPGLSVDGAMVERVPGGVLVEPAAGAGSVTFRSPAGVLGTVLAVPSRLRLVILSAEPEPGGGVLTWTPYRPHPGDDLVASLRREHSALASDPGPFGAELIGSPSVLREADEVWTGPDGRVFARFTVPGGMESGRVGFVGSGARHDSPSSGIMIRSGGGPTLVGVRHLSDLLLFEFDAPVEPASIVLELAEGPSGPWAPSVAGPSADPASARRLQWPVPSGLGSRWLRAREPGGTGDGILCTLLLAGRLPVARPVAYAPFPNPSDLGTLWRVDLEAPAEAAFEVFDVAGRRVHGPERLRLEGGRNELWWDGRVRGRRAAAGVYFLKVSAPAFGFRSRIVLLSR